MSRAFCSQTSAHPFLVPQNDRAHFLRQFLLQNRAAAWSLRRGQAADLCSVCRCMSSSLVNSSLRRLTSSSRSVSRRWVAFDHFLLLAQVVGLLFESSRAACPAVVRARAASSRTLPSSCSTFGFFCEGLFLDLEVRLPHAARGVLLRPFEDPLRFRFGVSFAQSVDQFDEYERQYHRNDDRNDIAQTWHGVVSSLCCASLRQGAGMVLGPSTSPCVVPDGTTPPCGRTAPARTRLRNRQAVATRSDKPRLVRSVPLAA